MKRCRIAFGLLWLWSNWHFGEGFEGISLEMCLGMDHYKVGFTFGSAEILGRINGAVETTSLEWLLRLGFY